MSKKREFNPEEEVKESKEEIKELETLQKELKEEIKIDKVEEKPKYTGGCFI